MNVLFLVESEIDQYLPEATTSPQFTIRRKVVNQYIAEEDMQLPLFGSTSKDDSKIFKTDSAQRSSNKCKN